MTYDPIKEVEIGRDSEGRRIMRREMTEEQVRVRDQLNIENTASRMRARVVATTARLGNGSIQTDHP